MEYVEFAATIAREAGSILRERVHLSHRIEYKGAIDIVTEVDRMSEDHIVRRIRDRYPEHDIMTEESDTERRPSPLRWIVDPLDGTTNYAHGFPFFCVTIAFEANGLVEAGVIYDPMRDELYCAQRGGGAFLNGSPLRVSATERLSDSLLATGFPYDLRVNPDNNIRYFSEMSFNVRAIRRAGSAALDLAYVAAGHFDGYWELRLKPWDVAAGWLLVEEAGGRVTDMDGAGFHLGAPGILASNGKIDAAMRAVFHRTDPLDIRVTAGDR